MPIFESGNSMYLPEMDADYNISAFLQFENEDHYDLTQDVPEDYRERLFRVGDPAPIIFWFKRASHIIEGDAEKARLQTLFGLEAKTHPVLRDLGEMLDDARTGKIKAQQQEWFAQEVEASYNDVFLEEPSRTRYWVSRYRVALENARKLTQPPHPIDVRLRRASSRWMEMFATKAEFSMLTSILGEASQGIYSLGQITDIMFAYMSHRIAAVSSSEITRWLEDGTVRSLFGRGLYDMYLIDGWPHVPFEYNKPDFLGILKEKLIQGRERETWKVARLVSELVLGGKDSPREIDDLAMVYIKEVLNDYNTALYQANNNFGRNPTYNDELPLDVAKTIVARHEQATDLSCIMHGDDRIRGIVQRNRFGLDEERAQMYRDYIANFREY
ncbi:hypothetical protein [Bradyrhizobium sp. WSM2793]|uniref:hypothetical protein n=1 Tax=Bradyrhizobium sp. WSM2793 TaxID=1038866 RepID=UPI0012F796F7|nr:hypothetical protein [Bradyrhizobium sp. WSM2793]